MAAKATNTALATKLPLAGGTMTGNTLHGDNVKDTYGTGADLEIYHDGSNSYIKDTGTGTLNLYGNQIHLFNAAGTEQMIVAEENGQVALKYNGAEKFATTAAGVSVMGGIALGGTGAANTLSDYETGTWTPTIRGSGTLTIAAIEAAHYTKIGSVVVLQTYLSLANNGNSTDMEISGMPFINGGTSVNANQYSMGGVAHGGGANMTEMKYCRTQSNTNYLTIYKKASTNVPQTDVQGNYFLISITYRTTD